MEEIRSTMRRIFLSLCLMLCYGAALLAQVKVVGMVRDAKTGEKLAGVYVSVYSGGKMLGAGYSDSSGEFSLLLSSAGEPEVVKALMMGYASTEVPVIEGKLSIDMVPQKLQLKAAVAKVQPVELRGDTTEYSAAAFRDETDRTLGEVLQRLPGIEVSSSGGITHNGQPINKFYIEGLDLLQGRYGLAVKNLSADDIKSVQVIENHQPIKALEGINFSDKSAVNIVLKETSRNSWLLSTDVGVGYGDRFLYNERAMVSRFGHESQNFFLVKADDTGQDLMEEMRMQRYMGRTGAFRYIPGQLEQDFSGAFGISRSTQSIPLNYYFDNKSVVGSVNHLTMGKRGVKYRILVQAAYNDWKESENSKQVISFPDGDDFVIIESDTRNDRQLYFDARLNIEKNTRKIYFDETISFTGQLHDYGSDLAGNETLYNQDYTLPSFRIENDLRATIRTNEHKAITLESDTKFVNNNHDFNLSGTGIKQNAHYTDLSSDNNINYSVKVARKLTVSGRAFLDLFWQGRHTELVGQETMEETKNDLNWVLVDPGISASTTWRIKGLETTLSVPLHAKIMSINMAGEGEFKFSPTVSPNLSLRFNLFHRIAATLNWGYSMGTGSGNDFLTGYILRNYRNASAQKGSLSRSHQYNANLNFRYNDVLRMFSVSFNAGYNHDQSGTGSSSTYYDDFTLTKAIQKTSDSERVSFRGNLRKHFGARIFSFEIDGGYATSSLDAVIQDIDGTYKTGTVDVQLTLSTRPVSWVSAEVSSEWSNIKSHNYSSSSVDRVTVEGSLTFYPFRGFTVKSNAYWLWQDATGLEVSNEPLIDIALQYKLKKITLFAECCNLLDVGELKTEAVSSYLTYSSSFRLRGLMFLAGLRMSL